MPIESPTKKTVEKKSENRIYLPAKFESFGEYKYLVLHIDHISEIVKSIQNPFVSDKLDVYEVYRSIENIQKMKLRVPKWVQGVSKNAVFRHNTTNLYEYTSSLSEEDKNNMIINFGTSIVAHNFQNSTSSEVYNLFANNDHDKIPESRRYILDSKHQEYSTPPSSIDPTKSMVILKLIFDVEKSTKKISDATTSLIVFSVEKRQDLSKLLN